MSNDLAILVGAVIAAFFTGWVLSKMASMLRARKSANEIPAEQSQIRSLEASLRVAQKHVADMKDQFEATCVDFNALKETHEKLEEAFEDRGQELDAATDAVHFESTKVRDLRRELTTRAEAKIRAEARAKAIETELSVMEAGSSAMQDEVERLAAEREDLTDQLLAATGSFALKQDDGNSSENSSPEPGDEQEARRLRSSDE